MSMEICYKAIKSAEKLGAQQAEAFYFSEDSLKAVVKKGELKRFERSNDEGIAIRVIINKTLGFYYTTNLNLIDEAVENAIKLARAGTPDPNFVSLPTKKSYYSVEDIYDKDVESLDESVIADILKDILNRSYDPRVKSVNSEFNISKYNVCIVNNLGVEGEEKSTLSSLSVDISAMEGDKYSSSFDSVASRHLKNINSEQIISSVQDLAIKGLNKKKIVSGEYKVLLDPMASLYLVCIALNSALNADLIQRKRSFLTDELNKAIGSEKLTVIDDGLLKGGLGSSSFDGEGSPSQRNILIEKGILKNYLYDSYTALKEGKESTGNAVRNSFRSLPVISSRNMIILGGNKYSQDMLAEIEKGIYFRSTFDSPNVITGEFSGMINEGFYIEKGEIKHALLQAGLGVSLRNLFNNIIELSKDSRWIFNYNIPYILVEKLNIAGQ